jgi:enoyl-CoA hydratase
MPRSGTASHNPRVSLVLRPPTSGMSQAPSCVYTWPMYWEGTSGWVDADVDAGVGILRLNKPDKLNALSIPMLDDFLIGLGRLGADQDVRGIVVTGAGRAFSAGDDLPATESLKEKDFVELLAGFQALTKAILSLDIPVVAAVNGIAVGGAAELTLACDARVGHPGSDYLFPENDVGLTISNAATYLLPRLLGSRALPLVLDARRISGTEAHALGLIDHLVESQDDVVPKAVAVVRRWVERGLATPYHLRLLRPPLDEVKAAMARENAVGAEAWASGSALEGIKRFAREQQERRSQRSQP